MEGAMVIQLVLSVALQSKLEVTVIDFVSSFAENSEIEEISSSSVSSSSFESLELQLT